MTFNGEVIDILYHQDEKPKYPPTSTGEIIIPIEFTEEEIEIGMIYDEEIKKFRNVFFTDNSLSDDNKNFPINKIEINNSDFDVINQALDNYTIEILGNYGFL